MEGGGGGKRMKPAPLKISRDSRMIRKAPAPIPMFQQRQPVIIHTYSPKVIETDAHNFMWLVQRLTGCSDTILRCKSNEPANIPASMPRSPRNGDSTRRSSKPPCLKRGNEFSEEEEEQKRIKVVVKSHQENESEDTEASAATGHMEEEIQHPAVFKLEHLLLSPTSSSDSGALCFNSTHRVCAPMMASPKSPLVSFDSSQFHQGPDQLVHPFATSSALAINSDCHALNSHSAHLFPWSPTPTPNEMMSDFPLLDLWNPSSEAHLSGMSPYSRLLGSIQSPATLAYKDMVSNFLKDATSNLP